MRRGQSSAAASEKEKLKQRLGDFDWNKCTTKKWLEETFGRQLKQFELEQIAAACVKIVKQRTGEDIDLDREEKRRKTFLGKWFHDNFERIKDILKHIVLQDESGRLYGHYKEKVKIPGQQKTELPVFPDM